MPSGVKLSSTHRLKSHCQLLAKFSRVSFVFACCRFIRFVPESPIRLCDSSNMHIETISILALLYLGLGLCEGRVRGRQFDEEDETIVELPKLGAIQGKTIETAWTKREVLQFVDIRYAEPPTGKYRFKVCTQNVNQVRCKIGRAHV